MKSVATITKAIVEMLKANAGVRAIVSDENIERADYVNMDAGRAPWIGVYRTGVEIDPRTLGKHASSFTMKVTIKLMVQVYEGTAEEAENSLERLIAAVNDALVSDLTFKGTVDMLRSWAVSYSYKETDSKTLDFQWAEITLQAEVASG